jgi:transposase
MRINPSWITDVLPKELNPFERGKIIGKVEEGLLRRQILEALNVPKSTVDDTIRNHLSTPTKGQSSPRSGRPKLIDVRTERRILRFVRTAPDAQYFEIQSRLGLSLSARTIYRILRDNGITNWRKKRGLH